MPAVMAESPHLAHKEGMKKWLYQHRQALLEGACSALQITLDSSIVNTHFVCVVLKALEIASPKSSHDAPRSVSEVSLSFALCVIVLLIALRS